MSRTRWRFTSRKVRVSASCKCVNILQPACHPQYQLERKSREKEAEVEAIDERTIR